MDRYELKALLEYRFVLEYVVLPVKFRMRERFRKTEAKDRRVGR